MKEDISTLHKPDILTLLRHCGFPLVPGLGSEYPVRFRRGHYRLATFKEI